MANRCKIHISEHRSEIEELRLNKKMTYSEIINIMKEKYNETISLSSLSRHFINCIDVYVKESIKSDKLRKIYVETKIKEQIDASINLVNTISLLNKQLDFVKNHMDDAEARKEVREIAKILDSVMRTALQFSDKLKADNSSSTSEDVYDRLLWSLEQSNVPVEYISAVKDKWEEYGKPK